MVKNKGYVLILVVGVVTLALILVTGLVTMVVNEDWFSFQEQDSQQALAIAESGINYYTWYLNHNPEDFQDGQGVAGPYVHQYTDASGKNIGQFVLEITAPQSGSTIGTVKSTGILSNRPRAPHRTISAQIGVPSLAKYAFVSNTDVWFGTNETTNGKVQSNGGVRFDGTATDTISSSVASYICQTYHGCNGVDSKPGVWGAGGPTNFFTFPVPAVDFDQISGDFSTLQTASLTAQGLNLPTTTGQYQGYHLVFQSNNTATAADDTVKVYKVNATSSYSGYTTEGGWQTYNDDITQETLYNTYSMPANGIIYVDDDVWVSGQTSSRVTVAAAHLPENASKYRSIVVPDNLMYYAKDGSSVIGLIAQNDVRVSHNAPSTLEIDAVMLAQKGKVIFPEYSSDIKTSITTYGGIITFQVWTWTWVSGNTVISGYRTTNSTYDPHLVYAPPPLYPTTGTYEILKWDETKASF